MASIPRLTANASSLTRFFATCAREANTPYLLCGATALIARGVISRATFDVDFHIPPSKSRMFRDVVNPKLNKALGEGLLVDGKTQELKDKQTKFRIFKAFPSGKNMKADVSESHCVYIPSAFSELAGVKVASVALMVVFKTCASARKNRGNRAKMVSDLEDLELALRHLVLQNEIVTHELQDLFNRETPSFTWKAFWDNVESLGIVDLEELEDMFHKVNVKKTRD